MNRAAIHWTSQAQPDQRVPVSTAARRLALSAAKPDTDSGAPEQRATASATICCVSQARPKPHSMQELQR